MRILLCVLLAVWSLGFVIDLNRLASAKYPRLVTKSRDDDAWSAFFAAILAGWAFYLLMTGGAS